MESTLTHQGSQEGWAQGWSVWGGSHEDVSRPFEGFAVRSERLLSSSFPQCKVDGKESCTKLAEPDVNGADGLLGGRGAYLERQELLANESKGMTGQVCQPSSLCLST